MKELTRHKDSYRTQVKEGDIIRIGQPKPLYVVIKDELGLEDYRLKNQFSESGYAFDIAKAKYNIKVVGNKYDTPELLNSEPNLEVSDTTAADSNSKAD